MRSKVKIIGIIIGLFFLVGFIGSPEMTADDKVEATPTPQPQVESIEVEAKDPNTVKVVRVVDGDTVEIDGGIKVRLIGIDTPETVDPNSPVGCYGKEASNYTREQLEGKEVRLEKDVSETDRYQRLLRYVWIDDHLFNETLVKEGFAQSSTYPPDVKYQDRFIAAQKVAREGNKGFWSSCNSEPTKPIPTPTVKPIVKTETTSSTTCKYSCSSPDRDCSDFSSHSEAQTFFNCCGFSAGNDPMRLDNARGVGNGLACESLP